MAAGDEVDVASILEAYRAKLPIFEQVCTEVRSELEKIARKLAIDATVKARPKSPSHLVIKALQKLRQGKGTYADPIAASPDLAAARIVVPVLADVERVCQAIEESFEVLDRDAKSETRQPNELGYLGVHYQVTVEVPGAPRPSTAETVQCEIQVHTIAQSAWATVSHPLIYKPVLGAAPSGVERIVYRAVSLVSLFDDEIANSWERVTRHPAYRASHMLDILIKAAVDWIRPDSVDRDVCVEVLQIVKGAYTAPEIDTFADLIQSFVESERSKIAHTYSIHEDTEVLLLDQPVAISVFERLTNRPNLLRSKWVQSRLPNELLLGLAAAYGTPIVDL